MNPTIQLFSEERAAIDRLLASESFTHAPRVQTVLKFLLDSLQEGRLDQINEQTIGQAVFGRPAGYNSAEDNIVRVTVRHLRERLERFYQTEGRDENWIVEIPRGNYVPVIRPRVMAEDPTAVPDAFVLPVAPRTSLLQRAMGPLIAILLAINLLAYYHFRAPAPSSAEAAARSGLVPALFLSSNQHVSVVLADSDLQAYRMIFKKTVPLSVYLERSYLPKTSVENAALEQGTWKYIANRKDTTLSSVLVADRLQSSIWPRVLDVRHPRDLSMRDFNRDNLILLGGPWINPWGQLFENRLNFRVIPLDSDASGSRILNVQPAPGEPKIFTGSLEGAFSVGYARIALLPNLTGTGKVILVGATSDAALEAGGDFLMQSDELHELLHRFGARSPSELPFFELVLEVRSIDSTPCTVRMLADRIVHPAAGMGQ